MRVAERAGAKPDILLVEMTQAAIAQAPQPAPVPEVARPREPSHVWRLQGATWADFQRLLELRGDAPVPRFAYLEGTHRRGIEPDECYVVGEVTDPDVPDLAIEVVWSSGGLDELDIYRRLRVREVWFWIDETLHLYGLRGNGYEPLARSEALPGLDHELLLRYVDFLSVTKAVKEYRAALRG